MRLTFFALALGSILLACAMPAFADQVAIGRLAFQPTIDTGYLGGENGFEVWNSTGPDWSSADFPIDTPLTFTSMQLLLNLGDGSSQTYALDPISPGLFAASNGFTPLMFSSSTSFSSAFLTGVTTGDYSWNFSASLLPATGNSLVPLDDFALIYAERTESQPVPEPGTLALLGTGIGSLWFKRRGKTPPKA